MTSKSLFLLGLLAAPLSAQSAADRDAVLKPVNQLFDGMRKHDSAMVRAAFAPIGRLLNISDREGAIKASALSPDDFAKAVGREPASPPWNEPIYDPEIRIEGRVATVWAWYDFILGDKWMHCGVDAFQLALLGDGWKITQIVDTRQTTGCKTPAAPK